ncbi:MAG TPA: transketolase [Nocardioides sp.]|uniref:transketolase n=1 Tax=uncultured Nocardioides sp. TaxID=198441 RepID=UPI00261795C0|nr:transketolase [uncultured Nocardioides sp.]HRD63324.1 transketolase [Nocardioides sp.]HRI97983.1 transketolase [Nocardioides sp.]HRK47985.1 transketolase [Nocardioides sp.]
MPATLSPPASADLDALREHAHELRRLMMTMTRGKGEGYIAQGLGIADCLAALYFHELRYDAADPTWPDRDRFLLSTGHYSIAMYAALARAGYLDEAELPTYGLNGSRLPMSTFDVTPGIEVVGGSLGQCLGQAVGMALGLRIDRSPARVFCEFSDGELDEGSTWEALMGGATFGVDNLVALVDCNGIQADGPVTVAIEPVADKLRAFGWDTREVNGNDLAELTDALAASREQDGRPKAIVLRTTPGFGIPSIMARPRAHFIRVTDDEWAGFMDELEANR